MSLKRLTPKQELFVQEYLIDFNATQAAIRAGYSEKSAGTNGNRMLRNAVILARVKEAQAARVERLCINQDWVLLRLAQVVDKALQAEAVEKWDYATKQMVETGEYVFDSRGANGALQMIGKHVGMFDSKATADVEDLEPVARMIKGFTADGN